jgi:hypothetical protein
MKCVILSVLVALLSTSCQSTKTEVAKPRSTIHERNFQIWLKNNDPSVTRIAKKKDALICPQDDGHMTDQSHMMFEVD